MDVFLRLENNNPSLFLLSKYCEGKLQVLFRFRSMVGEETGQINRCVLLLYL